MGTATAEDPRGCQVTEKAFVSFSMISALHVMFGWRLSWKAPWLNSDQKNPAATLSTASISSGWLARRSLRQQFIQGEKQGAHRRAVRRGLNRVITRGEA
jgi:hypothetical protein